jgi:hypothetical protein
MSLHTISKKLNVIYEGKIFSLHGRTPSNFSTKKFISPPTKT